jgi:serine/threonine-protein kinase
VAAEESASAVGTLLNGTYRLERVIAEGGMGVVYEAAHVRLPRRFAVKVLGKPIEKGVAQTALQRFRREAEIASTLAHPHIVEVFDYQVAESGAPYLAMELLEGEDLADRLRRAGRLPIVAALRIIDEIAQALDVAHAAGVVHRDLKPANIFLSKRAGRDDFVKVLDFGVSKLIDAATLTHEKAMVGTPLYMSPEQAVGTQELAPASDVFSLGSIAFEMLTGRRAFAAASIPSILYQIVHGPTPTVAGRAPGIPPEIDEIFARVLAKKRDDRYQRAGDFSTALLRILDRRSGQMPIIEVPTPPIEDELPPPLPLDEASPPTGAMTSAGATEVDPSTKAEEAMEAAEASQPPDSPPSPSSQHFTGALQPKPRWRWPLVAALAASAATAALVWRAQASLPAPAALAPPEPPVAEAPRPVATPLVKIPVVAIEPAEAIRPKEVRFTFNVVPKRAEVRVDDRHVSGQVKLKWQDKPRRVRVTAPGYLPITMMAPSTESRVFELHMERAPAPKKPRPAPSHDAAPVQDL